MHGDRDLLGVHFCSPLPKEDEHYYSPSFFFLKQPSLLWWRDCGVIFLWDPNPSTNENEDIVHPLLVRVTTIIVCLLVNF